MICFCFLLLGFSNTENIKKKEKTPSGTVRLNDSLFIDKTEVGNMHWMEFMYWLEMVSKDSIGYQSNELDTLVWNNILDGEYSRFTEYYHRHPSYNNFPVVGLSYEQATWFCEWRSKMVNERYEKEPSANPFPGKKYSYRLPTINEWEIAAANKLNVLEYPFGAINTKIGGKGKYVPAFNCVYDSAYRKKHREYDLTLPLTAYLKNNYGCYNMIGNVSEMVSTKGIAKGGNFLLPLDSCKINMEQHYTKPEAWLGFRCICEIVN